MITFLADCRGLGLEKNLLQEWKMHTTIHRMNNLLSQFPIASLINMDPISSSSSLF